MEASLQSQLDVLLDEDLASVRDREQKAFDHLMDEFQRKVVLFGAGNLGQTALACLRSVGIEPLAFSDNNSELWGRSVQDLEVLSPADASYKFGSSAAFFVTIWSLGHRFGATRQQLNALGCRNIFSASALRWKFADRLLPFFCQDLPHKMYEERAEVGEAGELWYDERSRAEYLAQVRWRAYGDYDGLGIPDSEESYFPDSIFSLVPDEEFVDCGAYDGDTLRSLIQRRRDFRHISAFEPDPHNHGKLERYLATLDLCLCRRISLHNLAVGAFRTQVRFNATGTEGAAVTSHGEITVECYPLDEILHETTPTYLKMDIEGAEHDAIAGAQSTIRKHHPVMAVCVYHKQNDLWRLPLAIRSLFPDYRFFLRTYEVDGWQTVCYAVPEGRVSCDVGRE
jgi:FkbM family methyltransferase